MLVAKLKEAGIVPDCFGAVDPAEFRGVDALLKECDQFGEAAQGDVLPACFELRLDSSVDGGMGVASITRLLACEFVVPADKVLNIVAFVRSRSDRSGGRENVHPGSASPNRDVAFLDGSRAIDYQWPTRPNIVNGRVLSLERLRTARSGGTDFDALGLGLMFLFHAP